MANSPATEQKSLLVRRFLHGLNEAAYRLWDFGSNALVGWSREDGIKVIVVPAMSVYRQAENHPRIFHGRRKMGAGTFRDVADALGVEPVEITFERELITIANVLDDAEIDSVLTRYVVTKTRQRAAFLLDISDFSLFSPEEQAAQLTTLEYSLNIAEQSCRDHGVPVDLARSNAGDGFYVWNRFKGVEADVNLFCVLMFALAHLALQNRRLEPEYVPTIRTCFNIGSHYNYFQLNGQSPMGNDYIVGNVTIELARLIEEASPNQILIAAFSLSDDALRQDVDARQFLDLASETLRSLTSVEMAGKTISSIASYLTGPQNEDGTFAVRALTMVDKHGNSHVAHNAKVNIFLRDDEPIFLGLQESDMAPQRPSRLRLVHPVTRH